MDFNDSHYRYLPTNLKVLLDQPPLKFTIYPSADPTENHTILENYPKSIEEFSAFL